MGRGFFSGVLWGLLVIGLAGAMASLVSSTANVVAKLPEGRTQKVDMLEVPAESEFNQIKPEEEPVVPQTDTTEIPVIAPTSPAMVEADETPTATAADPAHMPVIAIPEIGEAGEIVAPVADAAGEIIVARPDAPVSLPQNPALRTTQQVGFLPYADKDSGVPYTEETTVPAIEATPAIEESAEDTPLDTQVVALPKPDQPEAPVAPVVADEPQNETVPEVAGVPVPKTEDLAPKVRINRLSTIGDGSDSADAEEQSAATDETTEPDSDLGALAAYAMAFENPEAKPVISVILIDNPDTPISDDALAKLPFPVSFAVDAGRDDAGAVAARYRSAGFEVLMLTNLPDGAKASDVEVAFEAYSRALPEAVAVLDRGATPKVARQLAGIMADRGFGLITLSKGLNSTQKAAIREGVPAALVFRELDAKGETVAQIRRYLDRAAFRAVQEGSVIMLGQTRPETIEALVQWALQDRAARLAIAPVSAILIGQ